MGLRRPTQGAGKLQPGEPAARDDVSAIDYPTTVEWLTRTVWEDGAKRATGTVMILAEDGVFKAWLHDREAERSCWLSAGSLLDLVAKVEDVLESGGGDWRVDRKGGKR
jgi:hypothetical protein